MFGHEKFGAYHDSIEFVAFVAELIEKLPDGHGKLIDQFRRASSPSPSISQRVPARLQIYKNGNTTQLPVEKLWRVQLSLMCSYA